MDVSISIRSPSRARKSTVGSAEGLMVNDGTAPTTQFEHVVVMVVVVVVVVIRPCPQQRFSLARKNWVSLLFIFTNCFPPFIMITIDLSAALFKTVAAVFFN